MITLFKKTMKAIAIGVLVFLVSLFALEYIGRYFIPYEGIKHTLQTVDHRMKPFESDDINEDGLRYKGTSKDLDGYTKVIFLGDSFTYGYRLGYKHTIPVQFEKLYNERNQQKIKTVNFGWISSSPILENRILRDYGKKYQPDVVFLILDMTDMWDDNFYQKLFSHGLMFRIGSNFPVTFALTGQVLQKIPNPWFFESVFGLPRNRFFHSEKPLAETESLFSITDQSIRNVADYAQNELHAKFFLVLMPRNYQYNAKEAPHTWEVNFNSYGYTRLGPYVEEPFRHFEKFSKDNNIALISLLDDFKHTTVFPTTFDDDPHLNAAGAKLAANFIYQHCETDMCFAPR